MIKDLKETFNRIHTLSDKDWVLFESLIQYVRLLKDEIFTHSGQIEDKVGYVLSGCLKASMDVDGKEVNHDLFIPGDFVSELDAYITRSHSESSIIAGSDTELVIFRYKDIRNFFETSVGGESLIRVIFETIHHKKREQEIVLRIAAANDKLKFLQKTRPELFKWFTQKEISTYLNIAPETFSRLNKS